MKHYLFMATAGLSSLLCMAIFADEHHLPEKWWPSPWGATDQKGALNHLRPATVLRATKLITDGEIYDMTHVYEESMPLFSLTPGKRKFTLSIPGAPSWGPIGENRLVWNEDYLAGHLTQDGTQFDALSHMGTQLGATGDLNQIRYYNGFTHAEIGSGRGFTKLGVENVTPIFTRGILIDFVRLLGRPLECGEEIALSQVTAGLEQSGFSKDTIQPGDALFYNTGWIRFWKKDNEKFSACAPGLSDKAGDWVVEQQVLLVGTDNWAVEAIPGPNPKIFAPNHQKFLVENGIYIMENLNLSVLIEAEIYEFAFVFGALPIKGATGTPGRPFAIR